jgi:hypothetical protein
MFTAYLLIIAAGLGQSLAGQRAYNAEQLAHDSKPVSFGRYANSFLIVMTTIFLLSWLVQSLTGWNEFNDEQRLHDETTVPWLTYLGRADFWEKTLQNWQSEFLAVGTMAVFTIYLRQRGSPESKPVGAPHDETGSSG